MSNHERIAFDESGVPGKDTFIFAGVAFRGDIQDLTRAWKTARYDIGMSLPGRSKVRKATRLGADELTRGAQFLDEWGMLPFSLHSSWGEEDQVVLVERINRLSILLARRGEECPYTPATYMWGHHAGACLSSLVSVLVFRGPVEQLSVSFDQFSVSRKARAAHEKTLQKWLLPEKWRALVQECQAILPSSPDSTTMLDNIRFAPEAVRISWNASGVLAHMSDLVASIYRRYLLDPADPRSAAWVFLRERVEARYGTVPECMERNVTEKFMHLIRLPWESLLGHGGGANVQ